MSTAVYPTPSFNPESVFYHHYSVTRRDEVVGVLLALFLGGFGAHHFYLRRIGLGILYLCFSWTPIPWVLGFIECFFMPGRVRNFNAMQAAALAASLGIAIPASWAYPYASCEPPAYAHQSHFVQTAYSPAPYPQNPGTAPGVLGGTLLACSKCSTTNPAGSRFCGSCGTAL